MPAVAHQSGRPLSLQCRCSRCTSCRWTQWSHTHGFAVTALPLCGSFPVEHGSRIRTRPVDEDYTAHATSRLLLGLNAPNSRVGGPKYWSHEYDLSSVQAHGDNSAPVASAFAASSSAKRASAYMAFWVSLMLCQTCDRPFPARAKRSNLARGGAQAMVA